MSDYIIRLEKIFRRAYAQDYMAEETRNALLYAQLQEGLKYVLMKAPAVSGAQGYQELCVAARNEEHHLNELSRRQQYLQESAPEPGIDGQCRRHELRPPVSGNSTTGPQHKLGVNSPREATGSCGATNQKRCYICNSPNHLANKCRASRTESIGRSSRSPMQPATRQVIAQDSTTEGDAEDIFNILLSDSEDDTVWQIKIADQGSEARSIRLEIQGVPARGIIDTAADITIMGGKLFKEVASVARLRKRDFIPADKIPHTYNRQPFSLDGRMDLEIMFGDRIMKTPVYVKMDAPDQLLLSEGVCRQLGIVSYHKDVCSHSETHKARHADKKEEEVKVTTQVNMVRMVHLLHHQSIAVQVKIESSDGDGRPLLVECDNDLEMTT